MKYKKYIIALFCLVIFAACKSSNMLVKETITVEYPITRKSDFKKTYFDREISDPYQWLEDDKSPETEAWVKSQNEVTQNYLGQIPYLNKIKERYAELFNYPKVFGARKVGDKIIFRKNDGLQNQSVMYIQEGLDGEPKVLVDPNTFSEDGTTDISITSISPNNRYIVMNISEAGSDWNTFRIYDLNINDWLDDELKWLKFGGASWCDDGFFYSRFPQPEPGAELSAVNNHMKVYYHELGDDQSNDELIYEDKENDFMYNYTDVTDDEKFLLLYKATGTNGYECYFMDLTIDSSKFTPLFIGFENKSSVVHHKDGFFYVRTDIDAPNYKLVKIDPNHNHSEKWETIIPESEHLLENVSVIDEKIIARHLVHATNKVSLYSLGGDKKRELDLPGLGTVSGFSGQSGDDYTFYHYTSFTDPGSIYVYSLKTLQSSLFFRPELKFNPDDYVTRQVTYNSKDGTAVPMFVVHHKDVELDGSNPTYLYGYGGFNISLSPTFSTSRMMLLENGGVYAQPSLRGGGEFGETWHEAGMLYKKQNVFDDFISAGEYLIAKGYTSKQKLAIAGGSNGGLLVGACMTQRPDLFQVALPAVGVLDMLIYDDFTVGKGWVPEYGSSKDSVEMFEHLLSYSPYHNLKTSVDYPATLVLTGDHDDRVVPAHSFKFAARLQEVHVGKDPVLIRIETDAGHGAGKPTSKIIDEQSDIWSFFFYNMGIEDVY